LEPSVSHKFAEHIISHTVGKVPHEQSLSHLLLQILGSP
jgi:hypothetical protein